MRAAVAKLGTRTLMLVLDQQPMFAAQGMAVSGKPNISCPTLLVVAGRWPPALPRCAAQRERRDGECAWLGLVWWQAARPPVSVCWQSRLSDSSAARRPLSALHRGLILAGQSGRGPVPALRRARLQEEDKHQPAERL